MDVASQGPDGGPTQGGPSRLIPCMVPMPPMGHLHGNYGIPNPEERGGSNKLEQSLVMEKEGERSLGTEKSPNNPREALLEASAGSRERQGQLKTA